MTQTAEDILKTLEERGTKRIKLGLCDIDGVLRGKYLSMDKFASVAKSGGGFCDVVFGWDVADKLYDNVAFSRWDKGFPDVPFRLDLSTMRTVPSEPDTPFFLAELMPDDRSAFHPICPRNVFRSLLSKAKQMGFACNLAFEYEFFVFDETPNSVRERHYRDLSPFTPGNFGYSVIRSSVHAGLHEELLEYCQTMNMDVEGYHTETGPGVMEAAIGVQPALEGADRAVLFKTFSKIFFQRKGLMPTFMARWSADLPGQSGHLHMSLVDASDPSRSVFHDSKGRAQMSDTMEHFVAGQVKYMRSMCALVAPTVNSYRRLIKGAWAPTAATWGVDNRTTAVRVIIGSPKSQRAEYRLAAADGNPYLVAAAALASGLAGIEEKLSLDEPTRGNAYDIQEKLPPELQLPDDLGAAAEVFRKAPVARKWLGDEFVDHFAATRTWEAREFAKAVTDWEMQRYFEII